MDIKDNRPSLENEMCSDEQIIKLLSDRSVAVEFYSALCNVDWEKEFTGTDEDRVIERLKGVNPRIWSCSWRHAGGIITDIRNAAYNLRENYMSFYCTGNEGIVSDVVRENFARMGWKEV